MFENKYKLALVGVCFSGFLHPLSPNSTKIMMPLVSVNNKRSAVKLGDLNRTIKEIKLSSNENIKLPFEDYIGSIMELISPCVKEILFISYSSYLSTVGDKLKDLFPLYVSLSVDDSLSSYKEDIKDLKEAYQNNPFVVRDPNYKPALEYLESPFNRLTTRRLVNLAQFKDKQTFRVGYKGPILMQSIHSSIASIISDRRTKMKEALESINKISDIICELYSYSKIVLYRKNQVLNLEKNFKNIKIREEAGSATILDLMEAKDSLEEYRMKLDMDLDNLDSLKKRSRAFGIDPEKIIEGFSRITEDFYSKEVHPEVFARKLKRSLKVNSAFDAYKSSRLEAFSAGISSFAPTLDVSANFFSNGHKEFKFGVTTEGIKFGQFLKYVGQRGYSASKYNHTLRTLYSETYEMLLSYNSRIRKNQHLLNTLKTTIQNRKLMESILNDAASLDSTRKAKVSDADVLKLKLSEDDSRIKIVELGMEILKSAFHMVINLSDETDFSKLFKRYAGRSKKIAIEEVGKNFYFENKDEIKITDLGKPKKDQLMIQDVTPGLIKELKGTVRGAFMRGIKRKAVSKKLNPSQRNVRSRGIVTIPDIMSPVKVSKGNR